MNAGAVENISGPENNKRLKQIFSSLIDSMRDAQQMRAMEEKVKDSEEANKTRVLALEKLQQEMTKVVLSFQDIIGEELTRDLEKQVSGLSLVAVDLTRKKIQDKHSEEMKEGQLALESERLRAFKSTEAFLSVLPFSLSDKSINVKLLDRAYAGVARYNCAGDIQFEFSLDCNKSAVLNKEFMNSSEGEIKIPVSLEKKLLKKDPVPEYERFDQYKLSAAEVTATTLTATYELPEKSSTIKITNSKRDAHSSLTVEYSSPDTRTNVTSEPTLSRYLNSAQLEKSSDALWQSILELEDYKISLLSLVSDGQTVLDKGKLDLQKFLPKAWRLIEPEVAAAVKTGGSAREGGLGSSNGEGAFDRSFVSQKISTLGEEGNPMLASLKLS